MIVRSTVLFDCQIKKIAAPNCNSPNQSKHTERVLHDIKNTCDKIAMFPKMGKMFEAPIQIDAEIRLMFTSGYVIVYEVEDQNIILHCIEPGNSDYIRSIFRTISSLTD